MPTFDDIVKSISEPGEPPREYGWIKPLPEYLKIREHIYQRKPVIVVSGGAGTGKSTFIKWLHDEFRGKILAVAPTGIAAVNIGGKTINSAFNFPLDWIEPRDVKVKARSPFKFVDVLVIDEISMVNANVLDSIDIYLRRDRKNNLPFGGLTVVLVGDLFQLPPVENAAVKSLFELHYNGIFKFFSAKVLRGIEICAQELTKTFRQKDENFVRMLLDIRQGKQVAAHIQELNDSCAIVTDAPSGAVTLASRNADVSRINSKNLDELSTPLRQYSGSADFVFKDTELPVNKEISLKVGAQVMLLNNTTKWFNGSIAEVCELKRDSIIVRVHGQSEQVQVKRVNWEYYDYIIDVKNKCVERKIRGTYTQFPVQLAWAITIHKSQGQTISAVHIDFGRGTFAPGQAYVALSRCVSMKTLSLAKELQVPDVIVDPTVLNFYAQVFPGRY